MNDDGGSEDVSQPLDRSFDFADGTSMYAAAWSVPETDDYPDGVHYRYHYGSPDGTILRYDNAHGRHERHNPDGSVEEVEFPGIFKLYREFRREVFALRREMRR